MSETSAAWKVYDQIAKRALKQKNLEGSKLLGIFSAIESSIFYGIDLLVHHTTFVEDNLCYLLSEIATGVIKSRKIYKGKRTKKRKSVGRGADMGVENHRIFSTGFDLFKLSRVDRQTAAPLTKRILRSMRLSTHVYENILRAFVNKTANYTDLCEKLLHLRIEGGDEEATKKAIKLIEKGVGCQDPNNMYGVVEIVRRILEHICKLQEKVIRAYQKMILKPARRKARSENEALENFQAGSMGLAHAVSAFDLDSNASFPTFAGHWINQRIFGVSKIKGPLIKLPWSTWESQQNIRRVEQEFEEDPDMRYVYTDSDIAAKLGKTEQSVRKVRKKMQTIKLVPLEDLVRKHDGTDSNIVKGEMLVDQAIETAEEVENRRQLLRSVLKDLTPVEKKIICLRFGLIDELENDHLDSLEVAKELLRQSACKAAAYVYVTTENQTTSS